MKLCKAYSIKRLIACATILLSLSCTSTNGTRDSATIEKDYLRVVERYSSGDKKYNGFYNRFEIHSTLLNTEVKLAQLERKADYYQWSDSLKLTEKEKVFQEMSTATQLFLSFFTPEKEADDLDKQNSIWRVYLVANGQRYQGEVRKMKGKLTELMVLYPIHNRFATAYSVSFNVSTQEVEKSNVEILITGPLGESKLAFQGSDSASP